MSFRDLFPLYPLSLKSPPKAKIKFGTRDLYVDFPRQAYHFMELAMYKATKSDLTADEVKEEWKKFLQDNKDFLTFKGKPFASVSLLFTPFSEKSFLKLGVKWDLFTEYLEQEARNFLSEMEKGKENIIDVYREIWANFFGVTGIIIPPRPSYFPTSRETFKKLLKRTGDYSYLVNLLDQLEGIVKRVEEVKKDKAPSVQLYTTNLIMVVQHLRALIDVVNIPAAYLLMRNILENFIKLSVYLDIARSIDPEIVLSSMFLYDYETVEARRYSLKEFRREFTRKFLKVYSSISADKTFNLIEFVNRLKEKQTPKLGVNPKVLEEFSESYGLEGAGLNKLYSACSTVIHNQPPLPFFSLLEVKFFKLFLEKYTESLRLVAERLIDENINQAKIPTPLQPVKDLSLKDCLRVAYLLEVKHGPEVKDIIKRAIAVLPKRDKGFEWIWMNPLTLTSVLNLISPSFSRLRDFSFTEEDMEDILEKIQLLSFKVSVKDETYKTLSALQEIILPELQKYAVFSSLKSIEQKTKTTFYLLAHYLPQVVEEMIKT
jgi:hypothetical protein